jgi:O-antigen/teichoic acid export membrane protein
VTATTVTNSLIKLVNPTVASVFPRMSSLFFQKKYQLLSELYHKATQATQIIIAPLACILVFFSYEMLLIWTQSETVALNTHAALTILSVSVLFNTALQTHYILQFACGLTWIPLVCNFFSSIILAPIIYYSILKFGISGAGLSWLLLNVMYFFIIPKITHSYILKNDHYKWIFNDTLYFIFSSILIFSISFVIKNYYGMHGITIIFLIVISLILYILSLLYFKPLILNDLKYTVNFFSNKNS